MGVVVSIEVGIATMNGREKREMVVSRLRGLSIGASGGMNFDSESRCLTLALEIERRFGEVEQGILGVLYVPSISVCLCF